MLVSDQSYDFQTAISARLEDITREDLQRKVGELEDRAYEFLRASGAEAKNVALKRRADCRYIGQYEHLIVEFDEGDGPVELLRRFEREHKRQWNFLHPGNSVGLVNLRIQITLPSGSVYEPPPSSPSRSAPVPYRRRTVIMRGEPQSVPAFARASLNAGDRVAGPAAIEEPSSDMVLPRGWTAKVDAERNLIVEVA